MRKLIRGHIIIFRQRLIISAFGRHCHRLDGGARKSLTTQDEPSNMLPKLGAGRFI